MSQEELVIEAEKRIGRDLEDYESVCQTCEEVYDRTEEDKEVAESGEYICPACWAQPE